ncbi:MAG: hypothetical protein ABIT05_09850 [Chitinophagaceae bacterium]
MKKIFTLVAGVLFAAAVMAADRRPTVSLNSNNNFKIMIDGKSYFANDMNIRLDNIYGGQHSIKVFEMKRGGFMGRRERLVSSSVFRLGRNDVAIRVDRFGSISIKEKRNNSRFGDDRDWNDYNGRDNDRRDDRNNRF